MILSNQPLLQQMPHSRTQANDFPHPSHFVVLAQVPGIAENHQHSWINIPYTSRVRLHWLINYGKLIARNQFFVKMTENDCSRMLLREAKVLDSPFHYCPLKSTEITLFLLWIFFSPTLGR